MFGKYSSYVQPLYIAACVRIGGADLPVKGIKEWHNGQSCVYMCS